MDELTKTIAERGDLAHLALFLWASGASGLLVWTLRELARGQPALRGFRQGNRRAEPAVSTQGLTKHGNKRPRRVEVFRQFAWNLAGSLAVPKAADAAPPAPKPQGQALMEAIPIDAEGRFAGYASVFGRLDEGGDIVMPGAFAQEPRAARPASDQNAVPARPQGAGRHLGRDRARTASGSGSRAGWCRGAARRCAAAADRRAAPSTACRSAFAPCKATRDGPRGHRRLREIDLWEISIVTFPMMDGARIAPGTTPARNARLERSLQAAMSAFKQ